MYALRKALSSMPVAEVTEQVLAQIVSTKNNEELVVKIKNMFKK